MKDIFADVSFGGLDDAPNIRIGKLQYSDCEGATDGVYSETPGGTETQYIWGDDAYEGPLGLIPAFPKYDLAVNPTGRWHVHRYNNPANQFVKYNEPNEGCYQYTGSVLIMKQEDVGGEMFLVQGNEPNKGQYRVRLRNLVYTDAITGDCILRVAAHLIGRDDRFWYEPQEIVPFLWLQEDRPSVKTVRHLATEIGKYSDYHPCYEDGPANLQDGFAPWISSHEIELLPHRWFHIQQEPLDPSDPVLQSDDSLFFFGLFAEYELIWEISLTDAGVTDLAALPNTLLDSTNLAGVIPYNDPIDSDLLAVPDLSAQQFHYHVPGSLDFTINIVAETDQSIVYNTPTSHVCKVLDGIGDICLGQYLTWVDRKALQADYIHWYTHPRIENQVTTYSLADFSLVLKPNAT